MNTNEFTPPHKPLRDSNLELLRIFSLCLIIAHHFVVNSTVINYFDCDAPSLQQWWLEFFGAWGKSGINAFILISGYFLCKSQLTWQRWVKLFMQMYFYKVLIYFIFAISGYEPFVMKDFVIKMVSFFMNIGNPHAFTSNFLAFYAFVPLYNNIINHIDKRGLEKLLFGLLFITTICGTIFLATTGFHPLWFFILYILAAYIRLYPNKYFNSLKSSIISFLVVVFLSLTSIYLQQYKMMNDCILDSSDYDRVIHFLLDSYMLLPFLFGLTSFLVAKNSPTFHNKFINFISAGGFGVLCIHANSDTMRRWLWQDVLRVSDLLTTNIAVLIVISLITPITIFIVCSLIDSLYRKFVEAPMLNRLKKIRIPYLEYSN